MRKAGEKTREKILQSALPLFAENGFAGTSTRLVAGAADVNVATLAYYFGDKAGLYEAVIVRLHEDLLEAAPGVVSMKETPAETVDVLVDFVWQFVIGHRDHIRLLLRHVLDSGGHQEVIVDRWSEPLMQQGERVIALFRPDWSRTERRMLALTVQHALVRFVIEDERQLSLMLGGASRDEAVPSYFKAFLKRELGISD